MYMPIKGVSEAFNKLNPSVLNLKGRCFYSTLNTLCQGKYYILGYNPGGNPDNYEQNIFEDFQQWPQTMMNAYLDEEWGSKIGQAPLQKNVQVLCDTLKVDTGEVFAANLIFAASENMKKLKGCVADDFKPVHEAIINIIQPEVIFTFGMATYREFKRLFSFDEKAAVACSKYQKLNWKCYLSERQINKKEIMLVGFPHFSFYPLRNDKKILEWVQEICHI